MLYYDRIDISEGIDLGDLCNDLCNGSHVLTMLSVNILLLSLLKKLIIVVIFITLANLKQLIY